MPGNPSLVVVVDANAVDGGVNVGESAMHAVCRKRDLSGATALLEASGPLILFGRNAAGQYPYQCGFAEVISPLTVEESARANSFAQFLLARMGADGTETSCQLPDINVRVMPRGRTVLASAARALFNARTLAILVAGGADWLAPNDAYGRPPIEAAARCQPSLIPFLFAEAQRTITQLRAANRLLSRPALRS
jgi:hypothetical protein